MLLSAQDIVIRWLLPLFARTFGARVCSQRRRALLVHPRLQGGPQALSLADDDGEDECNDNGVDPHSDDRFYEQDCRIGLVVIIVVEFGKDEDGEVDDCVHPSDQVEDSRDEEQYCGLEWSFGLAKINT